MEFDFIDRGEVGRRIRYARKADGLKQLILARKIGISSQQLYKFERGENRIAAEILYKISIICGRDMEWFFSDADFSHDSQKKVLEVMKILAG